MDAKIRIMYLFTKEMNAKITVMYLPPSQLLLFLNGVGQHTCYKLHGHAVIMYGALFWGLTTLFGCYDFRRMVHNKQTKLQQRQSL